MKLASTFAVAAALFASTTLAHAFDTTPSTPATPPDLKAAQAKIQAGDFDAAIPILTAVTQKDPNNPDALNLMGYSLRKTGQTQLALEYYNKALSLMPKHLGANEYLGELMSSSARWTRPRNGSRCWLLLVETVSRNRICKPSSRKVRAPKHDLGKCTRPIPPGIGVCYALSQH
jgi:tetratricopeptide (TPR) repeat protein